MPDFMLGQKLLPILSSTRSIASLRFAQKSKRKPKAALLIERSVGNGNKVSVNQELVDKITREQEEEVKAEGRGKEKN